jgi:hypothetical protein
LSNKRDVTEAVDIARSLVDGDVPVGPPVLALAGLARRFAATVFDVPDDRDADGYLFQYGKVNWFPEPTFVLSMVRQLRSSTQTESMNSILRCSLSIGIRWMENLKLPGATQIGGSQRRNASGFLAKFRLKVADWRSSQGQGAARVLGLGRSSLIVAGRSVVPD